MALIVEDGTGIAAANAYASQAHVSAYHARRGTVEDWACVEGDNAAEGMIIEATRLIERSYGWLSGIATETQGLGLPRLVIRRADGRTISAAAQVAMAADATSVLALRLYQDRQLSGRPVKSEALLDYSVTYEDADEVPTYPEVDAILASLMRSGGLGGGFATARLARWS